MPDIEPACALPPKSRFTARLRLSDDENGRAPVHFGQLAAAPLPGRMGLDPLVRSREVHGDGQARLVSERLHQLLHQLHVAVRSFDEKLRLPLPPRLASLGVMPWNRVKARVKLSGVS